LEQHSLHDQHTDEQRADRERRAADHPEEAQRLLREASEEKHGEQVEQAVHVLAKAISAAELVLRRLRDLDLPNGEPLLGGEHGQEPMLVAIDRDLLRYAPAHDTDAAAEIVERLARDRAQQRVKAVPAQRLEAAAAARPAMRNDEIGVGCSRDELRKLVRVHL